MLSFISYYIIYIIFNKTSLIAGINEHFSVCSFPYDENGRLHSSAFMSYRNSRVILQIILFSYYFVLVLLTYSEANDIFLAFFKF